MPLYQISLPGPWWHDLTYKSDLPLLRGTRVIVPVGRGKRVGICMGETAEKQTMAVIKNVICCLDKAPVLSESYLHAANIISYAFLCSQSEVLKSLLPSPFWLNIDLPAFQEADKTRESTTEFIYQYSDEQRCHEYTKRLLMCQNSALCIFPEREQAKAFYKSLTGVIARTRLFLWPASGGENALKVWRQILCRKDAIVIGGPGAAAAPFQNLQLIIIEGESSSAWRTKKYPFFSLRSFAAARARSCGASLILGGRLPSSRVYKNFTLQKNKVPQSIKDSVRILDLKKAAKISFKGIQCPLPLSDVVVSETLSHVTKGEIVFWLLDRRGVSAELRCADCGQVVACSRCGTAFVYENDMLRCPVCGQVSPLPLRCPACGGILLQGVFPGLEKLYDFAKNLIGGLPVELWHLNNPKNVSEEKERIAELRKKGGLLLGSRRALSLLDTLNPKLLCWIDADAEARQPHYDARFNAYSMLLESCCRGSGKRQVILQTRRGGQPYLSGLHLGWAYFWEKELPERDSLGFPPYASLAEIMMPESWSAKNELIHDLNENGFFPMQSDTSQQKVVVIAPKIVLLRRVLKKYFSIGTSKRGYPQIQVWTD
jgi:primosomal protein N' (replication factor Y)